MPRCRFTRTEPASTRSAPRSRPRHALHEPQHEGVAVGLGQPATSSRTLARAARRRRVSATSSSSSNPSGAAGARSRIAWCFAIERAIQGRPRPREGSQSGATADEEDVLHEIVHFRAWHPREQQAMDHPGVRRYRSANAMASPSGAASARDDNGGGAGDDSAGVPGCRKRERQRGLARQDLLREKTGRGGGC